MSAGSTTFNLLRASFKNGLNGSSRRQETQICREVLADQSLLASAATVLKRVPRKTTETWRTSPRESTATAEAVISAPAEADRASVQFSGIRKSYGAVHALAGIDLSVPRGSVLALLGPNGAGKSTLFGCLLGLVRPTGGSIHFAGRPVSDVDRARFGYVAERIALYPQRTVRENGVFFAGLRNQWASELERQLERVGMHHVQQRKVGQLSKGMLQRVGLAIALCGQPELLVLDEPFNGLDPALLEGLHTILLEEKARGATLLISTHTMSAIEPLATDVAVLLDGRLATAGSLEAVRAEFGPGESLETIYHRIARQRRCENTIGVRT